MGSYYSLCCKDCEVFLEFGKKILEGELVVQGMFSEKGLIGLRGGRAWFAFQAFLQEHEVSRCGNCHDYAAAESFFQLLKRERVRRKTYGTREEARSDVFDYI